VTDASIISVGENTPVTARPFWRSDNEAMLACFFGGLNKEIQHILDYKEYNTITHLFHLACKAKLEVQDRQPPWRRANISAGCTSSWCS
jgi:hypothetical protein